jgi:large subunit ribosomal protein L4
MRRAALRSALSVKAEGEQIVLLDELSMPAPKTKEMAAMLGRLVGDGSVLILLAERDENVEKSARNLPHVKTLRAGYLNIRDLLGHDMVVMPMDALELVDGFLNAASGNVVFADADSEEE